MPNTINEWKTIARVSNPERLKQWQDVFGRDTVPVVSILPRYFDLPGHPNALAYMMDLKAITSEQRQRLIESIATRFNLDSAIVARDLDAMGCPILAADVVVSTSDQGIMFSMIGDDWGDEELDYDSNEDDWDDL